MAACLDHSRSEVTQLREGITLFACARNSTRSTSKQPSSTAPTRIVEHDYLIPNSEIEGDDMN